VICKDPRFASLTRVSDLSLLEPATRQLVQSLVSAAQQMGIEVMIYETYRSQNRQQELFNNGATKLRTVGVHHYGLACDIVRVAAGEPCWKGDFSFLGQLAHSSGLIWGGDWGAPEIKHSFVDSVHVQRCTVTRQGDLFTGVWYPNDASIRTTTSNIFLRLRLGIRRGESSSQLREGVAASRSRPGKKQA
jgi:hypothetical protein